jgi:hypothetical protein
VLRRPFSALGRVGLPHPARHLDWRVGVGALASMAGLLVVGCLSSSDPELVPASAQDDDDMGTRDPCVRFCGEVEESCTGNSTCRDDCGDWMDVCGLETAEFLECAEAGSVDCDAADSAYVPGCASEWVVLSRCLDPEPAEAFESCRSSDDCVEGHFCLPTSEPAFRGNWLCAPACDRDAECFSGCCGSLDTGEELCGLPADCAPVSVGNPCLTSADCESGDCRWGSCVVECERDLDCGANLLGLANHCHTETRDDGTVQSACLPGCSDATDCRFYFEDPYYTYDPTRVRVPLGCVEGPSGKYCY